MQQIVPSLGRKQTTCMFHTVVEVGNQEQLAGDLASGSLTRELGTVGG